jgi:hypothetical protein
MPSPTIWGENMHQHQDSRPMVEDGDQATPRQLRSFSLSKRANLPDTQNEGTVTGHFQTIKGPGYACSEGRDTAGDNPRRDRGRSPAGLESELGPELPAAANGEPVVVRCSARCRHVHPAVLHSYGTGLHCRPGACEAAPDDGTETGSASWIIGRIDGSLGRGYPHSSSSIFIL